jgi:hypothetical protein
MGIMDYLPQFGQNTDQQMPQDDSMMQLELQRRMKFADALRNQAAPEGQIVSGHYVAPSWTQHLAGLANKYIGGQEERNAIKQYGDYLGQQKKTRQEALASAIKKLGPQDITEQSTYDIQVPNGKQAGPTDNLGGMQPYESGMKNISVPMTKVTGTRQPSYEDALAALGEYANSTNQPDLAEKLLMNKATSLMTPDSFELHNIGDTAYLINKRTGKPVIGDNGQAIKYEGQQKPRNAQWEKVTEGTGANTKEVTYQVNPDGTRVRIAEGSKFSPKESKPSIFDVPNIPNVPLNLPKNKSFKLDNGGSVNGTLDEATGKYYATVNGKKQWIEE